MATAEFFRPILAQRPDGQWTLLVSSLMLGAALLVGALLIALASRWRKRAEAHRPSASDQLAHYRKLYEEGAISQEEYHRLRNLLAGQMRRELDVPPPPPLETEPDQE